MTSSTGCTEACPPNSVGVYQAIFNHLILSLLNSTCDITSPYPADVNNDDLRSVKFDFIVVGAGASGSIVANRLTEVPYWNTLLIEAGDDPPIESDIPSLAYSLWKSKYVYEHLADESAEICRGQIDNQCSILHGKILGGSTSINGMVYARGSPRDYDTWAEAGNEGWNYASLLSYFKKVENVEPQILRHNGNHGLSGYQRVQYYGANETREAYLRLFKVLNRGASEAGVPFVEDLSVKAINGVGKLLGTLANGIRQSTARSYLSPIRERENLYVMKNAYVTKILIDDLRQAYGVTVRKNDVDTDIMVNKEVILSAGAFNSPQLLMLSGIGPKKSLEDLGLKVIQELNVGSNLQDHLLFLGGIFSHTPTQKGHLDTSDADNLYNFLTKRVNAGGQDTILYYDSVKKLTNNLADIEYTFDILKGQSPAITRLGTARRIKPEIVDLMMNIQSDYLLIPLMFVLKPILLGRVYLKSVDPFTPVGVEMHYPADPEVFSQIKRKAMAGIDFLMKLNRTKTFTKENIKLIKLEINECDGSWECIVRHMTMSGLHHVGTCKMGPKHDSTAVVDPTLKVYGVTGLRVVDASVIPSVPAANTNIPCMMVGEKAADMIKAEWHKKSDNVDYSMLMM